MRKAIILRLLGVLPSVLLCLSLAISLSLAQDPEAGNHVLGPGRHRLIELSAEFKVVGKDLSDMAKVADRSTAIALSELALQSMLAAEWASDQYAMLWFSCGPRKDIARLYAEQRLKLIAATTAIRVEGVNQWLTSASTPAVVQRGGDLREKMRELTALLEKPLPE